jgi:hypothetical protein
MTRVAELMGYDEATDRELYVVEAGDVTAPTGVLRLPAPHYVCLVAGDTTAWSEAAIHRLAAAVLGGGGVHVAVWGRGCERAHRLLADAVLIHETSQAEERIVMTSWHDEGLDEALLYFLTETRPSAAYRESCRAGLVVALGPPAEVAAIRGALAAPMEHVARLA